jgi:hypothetical protein
VWVPDFGQRWDVVGFGGDAAATPIAERSELEVEGSSGPLVVGAVAALGW